MMIWTNWMEAGILSLDQLPDGEDEFLIYPMPIFAVTTFVNNIIWISSTLNF